jgi:hypothetical protein
MVVYVPILDVLDGTKTDYNWRTWVCGIIASICYVVSYSVETIIMWYFGFNYFNCGRKLSFSLRQEPLPPNLERNHRLIYLTGCVINVGLPTLYAYISAKQYIEFLNGSSMPHPWVIYVPYFGIGFM